MIWIVFIGFICLFALWAVNSLASVADVTGHKLLETPSVFGLVRDSAEALTITQDRFDERLFGRTRVTVLVLEGHRDERPFTLECWRVAVDDRRRMPYRGQLLIQLPHRHPDDLRGVLFEVSQRMSEDAPRWVLSGDVARDAACSSPRLAEELITRCEQIAARCASTTWSFEVSERQIAWELDFDARALTREADLLVEIVEVCHTISTMARRAVASATALTPEALYRERWAAHTDDALARQFFNVWASAEDAPAREAAINHRLATREDVRAALRARAWGDDALARIAGGRLFESVVLLDEVSWPRESSMARAYLGELFELALEPDVFVNASLLFDGQSARRAARWASSWSENGEEFSARAHEAVWRMFSGRERVSILSVAGERIDLLERSRREILRAHLQALDEDEVSELERCVGAKTFDARAFIALATLSEDARFLPALRRLRGQGRMTRAGLSGLIEEGIASIEARVMSGGLTLASHEDRRGDLTLSVVQRGEVEMIEGSGGDVREGVDDVVHELRSGEP